MGSEPEIEKTIVHIVVGQAWRAEEGAVDRDEEGDAVRINVLLTAIDDQDCIEKVLAALAGQGYGRVELDRIGIIESEPEDPTFAQAYWNAIDGEVAVIAFHG